MPQRERSATTNSAYAEPTPLPYHWTQGNAPQAHKDAAALFGPLALRPGQYRWVAAIPEAAKRAS